MKIENWTEVRIIHSERGSPEPEAWFGSEGEAKSAGIKGWYDASPEYHSVNVIWVDGKPFKLVPIQVGRKKK